MKLDILFARVLDISLHAYVLCTYIYATATAQVKYKYITVQGHFHRHMNCGTFRDKLLYLLASTADAIITAQIRQKLLRRIELLLLGWWYH